MACCKHACWYPGSTKRRPCCKATFRLSPLNSRTLPAYILGIINIVLAVETQPFSVLRNADPRPPRLPFMIVRFVEISLMCLLFEKSLRRDVSYPVDFDALASYGLGALVALYLLCLLIPYQLREANPATLARALSFGL